MALSEGFRGFVDMLKGTFINPDSEGIIEDSDVFDFDGDYVTDGNAVRKPKDELDELYPTTTAPSGITRNSRNRGNNVAQLPSYKSSEIAVIEPRSFSDSNQIVKKLIEKKTVVLHLDLLDKEQSQRTIDFVCGASHALQGDVRKISDSVVIFAPDTVALSMESAAVQNKFTEPLWNKP